MADDLLIVNLPGSRLMTSRCVCNMDMPELIPIAADRVADTPLIDLHVIYII